MMYSLSSSSTQNSSGDRPASIRTSTARSYSEMFCLGVVGTYSLRRRNSRRSRPVVCAYALSSGADQSPLQNTPRGTHSFVGFFMFIKSCQVAKKKHPLNVNRTGSLSLRSPYSHNLFYFTSQAIFFCVPCRNYAALLYVKYRIPSLKNSRIKSLIDRNVGTVGVRHGKIVPSVVKSTTITVVSG